MNRPIKYEAWVPDANEMHTVEAIHFDGNGDVESVDFGEAVQWSEEDGGSGFSRPGSMVILRQFTGLTDKNGKEIYEGDIVQTWGEYDHGSDVPSETFEEAMPIIFNDGQWWWGDGIGNSCPLNEFDDPEYIEVIGNIHQNPELLTK